MALFLGTQEITPTLTSNGASSPVDDWGQSLQGNVVVDDYYICAYYKSYSNSKITSFTATNATEATMIYCFGSCNNLTTANFPQLTEIKSSGLDHTFNNCYSLTSVSLPLLKTAGAASFNGTFQGCTSLTSVSFPSLDELDDNCFGWMGSYTFGKCTSLTSVSFPALKTTSVESSGHHLSNLFDKNTASVSGTCTVHFPSNLESTISGLSGYPLFGGTDGRIVLAFDLPATS